MLLMLLEDYCSLFCFGWFLYLYTHQRAFLFAPITLLALEGRLLGCILSSPKILSVESQELLNMDLTIHAIGSPRTSSLRVASVSVTIPSEHEYH